MILKTYNENLIQNSSRILGEAFERVCNGLGISSDKFMEYFINSGYAEQFEEGNPSIVAGVSGSELASNILYRFDIHFVSDSVVQYKLTKEYWCGWVLAYYQWKSGLSFEYIHSLISMKDILKLYTPLHEASEEKFVDVMNKMIKEKIKTTRLQQIRKKAGLSQSELAKKSGVNLRTLQQYELGTKDINKASALSVYNISKVLNCNIKDLFELI